MRVVHTLTKTYTAQRNSNGNIIVCRGDEPRKSYAIIFTGSYDECYMVKLGIRTPHPEGKAETDREYDQRRRTEAGY